MSPSKKISKKKSKPAKKATKEAPRAAEKEEAATPDLSGMGEPIQTYLRSLPVVLTPSEYDERGHEAGTLSAQIKALEADKRAKNEAFNAEIKKANARLDQVHGQLNTRTEDREVSVSVFADIDKGLKLTVRTDTGAVLSKDKMSPAEKRGDVAVVPPPPPVNEETPTKEKRGRKVKPPAPVDEVPPIDDDLPPDDDEKPDDEPPADDLDDTEDAA